MSPIMKSCVRHGLYQPGAPSIPRGRCPRCYAEDNQRRKTKQRDQGRTTSHWKSLARKPTPIVMGEGGTEVARFWPLGSRSAPRASGGVTVNINGPVYGANARQLAEGVYKHLREIDVAHIRRGGFGLASA